MDERDRLKSLIEYVRVLSNLQGNYHNEIRIAIAAIEKELGITKQIKATININESVLHKKNFIKE